MSPRPNMLHICSGLTGGQIVSFFLINIHTFYKLLYISLQYTCILHYSPVIFLRTQQFPECSAVTCEMNGLIWFLICMRRPSPLSTMVGKLSRRRVCPVGAVSNTTTEKFMPFTNLQKKKKRKWDKLIN